MKHKKMFYLDLFAVFTNCKYFKMAVDIRIASARQRLRPEISEEISNLVTPGDVITSDTGFMRYGLKLVSDIL